MLSVVDCPRVLSPYADQHGESDAACFLIFSELSPLTRLKEINKVSSNAQAFNSDFPRSKLMSKKTSASKPKPMTQEAKARIYQATASENGGTIPAESFAARAARAADKTTK
ncbi:hypothetical protein D3M70_26445 [Pseudomonas sp. LS-2]|nr:hypothetical protein D3M70_26445 [Pseudomonas sp. LS-2]